MFNKKKPFNSYENHADELLYEVQETHDHLIAKARQAITRTGVVSLYPDGADRTRAWSDCDKAKHSLLVAIGSYEGAQRAYNEYIKKNADKLDGARKIWTASSHEIIEWAYENYYKK